MCAPHRLPKSQHSRQVAALDLASSESISGINDTAATFLTPRSVSFSTDISRFPALSSDCPCSGSLDKAATLKMPKTRYRKSKAKLKQSSEIDSPAASSLKKPEANRHRKAKAKLKQNSEALSVPPPLLSCPPMTRKLN